MPYKNPVSSDIDANIEHERLTSLINSMADGVLALDESGAVVLYNGAALNILDINNITEGTPINRYLNVINKNDQPVDIRRIILNTKAPTSSREWRIAYEDKSTANVFVSIAPVRLGFGRAGMKGYVLLLRDITHEKSLEEERDEFISVVSHELRTPIAIAEGNISNAQLILKQTNNRQQISKALQETYDQIIFLSDMINDLSTLSRAERGKLNIEAADINVHELISELVENYQPQAKSKGLEIITKLDPHLTILRSSELYVREILQNFVTNALKYTEKGHITIAAQNHPDGTQFQIVDTGIGISKSDQAKIFDKFFRSEDYRTRQNNGTGLGLYVTLKLLRLLHGDVRLESRLNEGSTFIIFIPNVI